MSFRSVNTVWLWIEPVMCHRLKLVVSGFTGDFIIPADFKISIYIYHCDAYRCYSVYASSRFWPCCSTECGDWENVHVQIGIDVHDFDVLACILYDHRYSDTAVYKFNNSTFYAVWLKIRYKNRQTFETMKCKSLKKIFQVKILDITEEILFMFVL